MTDAVSHVEEPDAAEILQDDPTRPALSKLSADQLETINSLVAGFGSRRAVLEWCQEAIIATLGQADDDWYRDLAMSRSSMACLLVTDARANWAEGEPPAEETAEEYRRSLAATRLVPACREAVRELRWSAVEYVDVEHVDRHPDPEVQQHPAMRPALSEMDDRQRWVVRHGIDRFDDVDELLEWVLVATQASYAEIEGDLSADLWRETHTREMLLTSPSDHEYGPFFRESFVARRLLPAFNAAARKLADRSGELVTEPETTDHSPMDYR